MTKKLKRPLALLFSAAVFLALLMFAPAEITEGTGFGIRASAEPAAFGDSLFWDYDDNGNLYIGTIGGTGAMPDRENLGNDPWSDFRGWIETVVISNGVTSIGNNAFYGCYNLKSITIPESVESIGNEAFYGCTKLESVTFETFGENPKLTSIGDSAFYGCSGLTSINIPDSVESIGDSAFYQCKSLENVTIGENSELTTIGDKAFLECSSLTGITIPDGVESIGQWAFESCEKLESVTIGENPKLTSIGYCAFYGCSKLTSITIPKSVNSIGDCAFWHCLSLTDITVAADNPNYISTDGVLFNKDKTTLIQCPGGKSGDSYVIPDEVKSVGRGAFTNCENLKSITIPESVTSIGDTAFWYCSSLTSITIPDGVTSIECGTFQGCSSLTSITIPAGVTSIGEQAFSYCYSLTSIFFPEGAAIGRDAITSVATQVKYTVSGENVTITGITLGAYLTSVVIPATISGKNVASFGIDAVSSCTELTSIFFPESTDVTAAGIPDTATQVKYTVSGEKVTITGITLGTDLTSVDIPAAIGGYPVAAVADSYWSMVGSHKHCYDSNNICTLCGIQRATKNADGYYEIGNAGQLYWFAGLVNGDASVCDYDYETNPEGTQQDTAANAILTADITVNTGVLNESGNLSSDTSGFRSWTPIGNEESSVYTGTFDGQNHTVSGLYFNDTEETRYVGLFGCVGNVTDENNNTIPGKVSNVGVVDSYFNGKDYVGGVCGSNGGTIENCYNTGKVSGSKYSNYIGGVCGNNGGTVENCYNTGKVSGSENSSFVGGVCGGGNGGTIRNCYNKGAVTGGNFSSSIGGVCGENNGEIENCYNTGSVSGTSSVGGVCGNNRGGTIKNCNSTGEVSGGFSVGGVCGSNDGTIKNSYNTGNVTATDVNASVGGVCGYNTGTIKNCYYLDGTTSDSNATSKTTEEFASGEVAYLLNGSTSEGALAWGQTIGTDNYPVLNGAKVYKTTPCPSYSNKETKAHRDDNDDGICDVCGGYTDGIGAKLAGYTLSLNGNIGVNFYMELSEEIASSETAYMQFTLPNTAEAKKVYVKGAHEDGTTATTAVVNTKTYYVFSCEVAAKEMTDTIKAQMFDGEQKGTIYTYTVKDYADYILANPTAFANSEKTVALVKAMLNYGAYSQLYFSYNPDNLANAGLAEADKALSNITAETLKDFSASFVNDSNYTGATTYYGSSLVLKSGTDIKHYFTPDQSVSVESYTCSDGTNDYEVAVSGSYIYVRVPNILAHNLGNNVSLKLYENGTEVGTISYSPMSYAYAVLNKYGAGEKDTLRNVVIALYEYYENAKAYRAA